MCVHLVGNGDALNDGEAVTGLPMCNRTAKTQKTKSTLAKEHQAKPLFTSDTFPLGIGNSDCSLSIKIVAFLRNGLAAAVPASVLVGMESR